jgi:hypothetical protein
MKANFAWLLYNQYTSQCKSNEKASMVPGPAARSMLVDGDYLARFTT